MAWYDSLETDVLQKDLEEAARRMWLSSLILAFREYRGLHERGILKNGKPTKKADSLGEHNPGSESVRKAMFFHHKHQVVELVEFMHGDGPYAIVEAIGANIPRSVLKRGIEDIENSVLRFTGSMEYDPAKLQRQMRIVNS